MRRPDPEQMSVDQLVARFADIGVEQDDAILKDDNRRFRRLYREMDDIEKELQLRPGDQRRALMALYRHANMQARLNAAKATLAVAPEQARAMLESIAASSWQPQAGDAGMTLSNLDRGIFKPT
jgi:cytochrome c oxidase assembly protein Cox11